MSMEPERVFGRNGAGDGNGDLYYTPRAPLNAISRLRKQPPGPFRSLGQYLDYEGWPGCQRFLELDQAIQAEAQDDRSHNNRVGWNDPGTVEPGRQTGPSVAQIARGFEELQLRRL
jgi:hypothetical protein